MLNKNFAVTSDDLDDIERNIEQPTQDSSDEIGLNGQITLDDVYLADILRCDFVDDTETENDSTVPKGFLKIQGRVKLVRKPLVLWSLSSVYERVSTDRLRRFIDRNKKVIRKSDYIFLSNFVIMLIGDGNAKTEEYVQVQGFRVLSEKGREINKSFMSIADDKGKVYKDLGVIGSLYRLKQNDNGDLKLFHSLEIEKPVSFSRFVKHVDAATLYRYLSPT